MNDTKLDLILEKLASLDAKVSSIETKIGLLETRIGSLESEVKDIKQRLDKQDEFSMRMFAEIESIKDRMDDMATKDDVRVLSDRVNNVLDRHSGMLDDDELERLSLGKQVDRHEHWIGKVAPKVGVSFTPTS